MKKTIFCRIWMDGDCSQMVLHTTKFHSELLYFLRTFACVSCPVCRIIGKVNRYLHCSDMSISQCSWAIKNPVFNRWSRSVDSRIHAKDVSISMKLHDLSKIFLTVVAIDQNSQKIVSRIDTAPSFLLWRISFRNKRMYNPFDRQNLHISIPNGARMRFRTAILIWSVFGHFMLLGYKKSIIIKLNNSSFLLCKN